ncbi:PREDICTED: protein Iojap, chloroplastic [Tarenaya hassleriana]|uniref:protein Iojap, chloroplastic n=1 Tax=Tarenaya hassleriana TaxID=28532 RepID=UPI00053C4E9C|nr:PREDICTED: protein Iojap, chloroplastic [Tarenaya hassleriana]
MASSAPLPVSGTVLSGEFRLPTTSLRILRKSFSLSFLCEDLSLQYQCSWRAPRSQISKFFRNSRISALGKGAEDGFRRSVNEDTDEELDELFKKYGKVVYRSKDQKPPTAEVDDDAESLAFAVEMAKVASDVKAADIKVLFVKPLVYWTRFFIIATAFSRPQIDAIGSRIRDLAENKYGKVPNGDSKPNSWTLLDFGDVVIHIFLPPQRTFYNLEEFYGNATPIELPFNQPPPRI